MASSQIPPTESRRASGIGARVPEAVGEAAGDGVHAGRPHEVGGGDEERPAAGRLQVLQRAAELAAERGEGAGLEAQLVRRRLGPGRDLRRRGGELVGVVDARGAGPGGPVARVEPVAGGREALRQRGRHRQVLVDAGAHGLQRRPEAALPHGRAVRPVAGAVGRVAGGPLDVGAGGAAQLRDGFVEALGAELVPGAVAGLALHAVPPALVRAVDDRRRLAGLERGGVPLGRDDLLEVVAVRHVDHVPVVQVEELARVPLHVVARQDALAADAVRVDRRLVPVEVHDDVGERGGAGRGQCLGHAAGRQAALALDDVHARRVVAVAVGGADAEADRAGEADAGGARG